MRRICGPPHGESALTQVLVLVVEVCQYSSNPLIRVQVRPEDAKKVVACQHASFEAPSVEEGFSAVITIRPEHEAFRREVISKLAKPLEIPM